jgi:hypothetical protein
MYIFFHLASTSGRFREISRALSAGPEALGGVSLMCPPGNEKDRFPPIPGKYVIPSSTGNQNSRFPLFCGSLVENVAPVKQAYASRRDKK